MPDDQTLVQPQGGDDWIRAREESLKRRLPPIQVPGYEIEYCLGRGTYGEVWVARDQNNTGRRVSIKFYTRRGGDWALLAREVEKLNFLATNRYVVQLFDVGWNTEPPYYVMEYMEKGSLTERLEEGTLAVPEAVEMFREICLGLVSAHNRGVLHCDLKPANILLGLDGRPRLADFGQSRLSSELTPALGTLFYMAPEQANLKAAPDARWDVYALGAVLYCLLTGEAPHNDLAGVKEPEGSTPLEEGLARYRQLLEQSPRPRKHRRCPGIDRALVDIIDRCLAINPARRYPNVQAVLNALDARALRRARRPLLVLGALGPVLLLLLMGGLLGEELVTAVERSTTALIDESKISNTFAAQAVAEKIAAKIDRRWRTLEKEAADPEFQSRLKAVRGTPPGSPQRLELQAWLQTAQQQAAQQAQSELNAPAWAVLDATGTLLARSPLDVNASFPAMGKNLAYKTFFTGLKKDLPVNTLYAPLDHPHRSNVYIGTTTGSRKVALSVPIWDGKGVPGQPRPGAVRQPHLGVLVMTMEVGAFAELKPREGDRVNYLAVLVDRRETEAGRKGAIVEHPYLAELRKKKAAEKDLEFFVPPDWFDRGSWETKYEDPIGELDPKYQGQWLAASYPVTVEGRQESQDTDWVVIVQERYDTAIGPVKELEASMLRRGWWALAVAVSVVTALWVFVMVLLNESSSSRLVAFLRRRAGIAPDSLGSQKASLGSHARLPAHVGPAGATLTDPPR